jgi:hypothetical protein
VAGQEHHSGGEVQPHGRTDRLNTSLIRPAHRPDETSGLKVVDLDFDHGSLVTPTIRFHPRVQIDLRGARIAEPDVYTVAAWIDTDSLRDFHPQNALISEADRPVGRRIAGNAEKIVSGMVDPGVTNVVRYPMDRADM